MLSITAVFIGKALYASIHPLNEGASPCAGDRENIVMTINRRNVFPCMYTMHQYNKDDLQAKTFYVLVDSTVTSEERDALTFLPIGVWHNTPQTQVLVLGIELLLETLPAPLLNFYRMVQDPNTPKELAWLIAVRYVMPSLLEKLGLRHALLLDVDLIPGTSIADLYSTGLEAKQAILGTRLYANPYTQDPGNIIKEKASVESDLTQVIISGGVMFMTTDLIKESIKNYRQSLEKFATSGDIKGVEIAFLLQQYWPKSTEDTVTSWLSALANFIIQRPKVIADTIKIFPSLAADRSKIPTTQLQMPIVHGNGQLADVTLQSEEQFFTNLQQVDCISRSAPMKYFNKKFNFNPNSHKWLSSVKTIRRYIENPQTLNESGFNSLIKQIQKFEYEFPIQQTEKTLGNLLKYLSKVPPKIEKSVDWSDSAWLTQFAKQAEEAFGSKAQIRLQQTYFNRDHPVYILDVKVPKQMENLSYVTYHFDHQKKPETYSQEVAKDNPLIQRYQSEVADLMGRLSKRTLSVIEKNIKDNGLAIIVPTSKK